MVASTAHYHVISPLPITPLHTKSIPVSLHVDLSLDCDSLMLSNVPLFWDSLFFVFFLPHSACHKMCQNGGTLNESTCTCDCANGFGGDDCESECIANWVPVMLLSRICIFVEKWRAVQTPLIPHGLTAQRKWSWIHRDAIGYVDFIVLCG